MARQRPTRLLMGPCIVEIDQVNRLKGNFGWVWPMWAGPSRIDHIVIRIVQYQLEVNRCRNEEVIVKGNFGWVWSMWAGHPRIDRIVIRIVQYQLEVNRCRNEVIVKGNFGWVWPMWAGHPRIDRIVIRIVQYQLEVNWRRNDEIIVKGNFGWVWPMWVGRLRVGNGAMHNVCPRGAPGLLMGPCIVEIDRIVIREFHYQFEVNRCRNEEIIVKGNFGWVWSMWAGRPRIDRIVIREFQGSSAYSVGGDSGQDGQPDGQTDGGDNHNIPTLFKKCGDNYSFR
ncbi:hypothetical protein DPMN_090010 [Dreissena polymorpha]|uniref:Uncharacterized protein n=1 Tax=Dreissena polymorpha TaxID=45954 RepID=A0A9D4QXY5_DREPO|nr:hypothetical protein DPMN_090010 [Dreissena polymorpha]